MAEEDVIAYPVQPSDHKRKLENVQSEILEQHTGSIDQSNKASVDSAKEASEYSQAKRPKLDGEADDELGVGNIVENND
ncbi:hypothetical protein Bca101_020868 [Brassica carinata]